MTTQYPFHQWIEASETSDTVLAVFGPWWDGDAAGGDPEASLQGGKLIRGGLTHRRLVG